MTRDGLALHRIEGPLTNAPVTEQYLGELRGQGLATALTFKQLAAQLKGRGIDLQALVAGALPEATPAQRLRRSGPRSHPPSR